MEELATDPVPKSTASYTLKYKVQGFSLQLGREKIHPGTATKPGVVDPHSQGWGQPVGMKLWPSPEDVGTDHRQTPSSGSTAGTSSLLGLNSTATTSLSFTS